MRVTRHGCCLLVLLGLTLGVSEAQQTGKDGKGPKPLTPQEQAALQQAGKVSGRLVRVNAAAKSFTLHVVYPMVQQGGGKAGGVRNRNARPRPVVRWESRNIDFALPADVNVRQLQPELQFDEKGKPIPLSPEELRERKGPDSSLPGYAAERGALKAGQKVQVIFGQGKAEDAEKPDGGSGPRNNLRVATIVILAEGQAPVPANKKK